MEQEVLVAATGDAVDRPLAQGEATVQTLNGVAVNGDLNVAARDIIHNHYYGVPGTETTDLPAALEKVPNFRDIHIATLGRATPGTGLWIFVWEMFLLWLDPDGLLKIMWGSGMPGAGKTILASIIINVLEARAKASSKPICVAYIYTRYSDHTKITVRDLLEVLVKQTIERHSSCLTIANGLYERHQREKTQPTEEELLHLLQDFTKTMEVTFYVIDALDEAPPVIQLDLVEKLASLNTKLLITSRPMKVVQVHFPNAQCFPIAPKDEDLDLHINREISRSAELRALLATADAAWRLEIVSTIKQKAGGMFLHASLQLEALVRDCTSKHDVREALEKFPDRIKDVYVQTWNRILDQPLKKALLAKSALLWVLTATRSLTVKELQHAIATAPDTHQHDADRIVPPSTIISLCRGLLTVEENSGVVRLVHYTAKGTLDTLVRQTFPHPHSVLAAVCITRLVDCGLQRNTVEYLLDLYAALRADPLLTYAYHEWSTHARQSLHIPSLASKLGKFVAGCYTFPVLTPLCGSHISDALGPLHLAVFYNLPINFAGSKNLRNPNLPSAIRRVLPLYMASEQNSQAAIEELLQLSNIDVNGTSKMPESSAPALIVAVLAGRKDLVSCLLKHPNIDVNAMDSAGETPLMYATKGVNRHSGNILEQLLAHPKVQVNLADSGYGRTALMHAARCSSRDAVELLLAHPHIQVNLSNHQGSLALMLATYSGTGLGTVEVLLTHPEIQVNQRDNFGMTALMWASQEGHQAIVAALLAHPDTRVDLADNKGRTAAMLASENGHQGIVKLLQGSRGR